MKTVKVIKEIGKICLVILCLLAIFTDGLYIYYKLTNDDTTITTNFINQLKDLNNENNNDAEVIAEDDNRPFVIEANYYSNENNNGIALQELKFNYFTDVAMQEIYSTGIQYKGDYEFKEVMTWDADTYVNKNFNYYNSYLTSSWEATTKLNRNLEMIISVGDDLASIQLNKKEDIYFTLFGADLFIINTYYYTYDNLFYSIFSAIENSNFGYGTFEIPFDLSHFFTVRIFNPETGKFEADDTSTSIFSYFSIKVNYSKNGATSANQSLYGLIDFNRSYGITNAEYWQERVIYNLTEADFNLRYSAVYNKNLLILKNDVKEKLTNLNRTLVNVTINITAGNSIGGLDYNALLNFKVNNLKIISSTNVNFYFLDYSLKNTELKTLQHTSNVTLIYYDNATNNEFTESVI